MRFKALDALRGIAALQVVIAHSLGVGQNWIDMNDPWVRFTPIRLVMEAHPAVVFFFVLSGFVLTLSITKEHDLSYGRFVIRRILRIYVPFFASICIAVLLCVAISPSYVAGTSELFAGNWVDYSPSVVMRHLLMTGARDDIQLNGVMWSLVHEMRISLILPFLVALFAFSLWSGAIAVTFLSIAAWISLASLGQSQFWVPNTPLNSVLLTIFYIFPFGVGIALALRREQLITFARQRPILIAASLPISIVIMQRLRISTTGLSDLPISILAGVLIILVLSSPRIQEQLMTPALQWLGRISYSLYLIHLPVLLAMVQTLSEVLALPVIVALAFPIILLAAHILNRMVEQPAARLSSTLTIKATPRSCNQGAIDDLAPIGPHPRQRRRPATEEDAS
ncbi:MAG: acyltransferase [Beijerinckiaceae bacterium]|nr:acyltransferase [Beijerinckiaceae bacterium]